MANPCFAWRSLGSGKSWLAVQVPSVCLSWEIGSSWHTANITIFFEAINSFVSPEGFQKCFSAKDVVFVGWRVSRWLRFKLPSVLIFYGINYSLKWFDWNDPTVNDDHLVLHITEAFRKGKYPFIESWTMYLSAAVQWRKMKWWFMALDRSSLVCYG